MEGRPNVVVRPPRRHDEIRGISLCSGVGGLDLGLHIAEPGYRSVCFVERQAFCASVLVARMADQSFRPAPVWDDLRTFDGHAWRGRVHLVSAGYPCQPFSYSGHRKGRDDPRHLWPNVARVVREVSPRWVFLENVPGHLSLGLDHVVGQLQDMGFGVAACVTSAAEAGGSHLRQRVFILGDANSAVGWKSCCDPVERSRSAVPLRREPDGVTDRPEKSGGSVVPSVAADESLRGPDGTAPLFAPGPGDFAIWGEILGQQPQLKPCLRRLDDGMADRVERCAAAGNGVVPLAAARAWITLRAALEVHSNGIQGQG
ncbi:DNA cytosine methyltransferase [Pseudaestuariivita sp.]|uniref:DNA cytosine methyltransferase n=1 Tax=Pseudaestuariivita sp. TaxID=2211669 RepID=UPI004058E053